MNRNLRRKRQVRHKRRRHDQAARLRSEGDVGDFLDSLHRDEDQRDQEQERQSVGDGRANNEIVPVPICEQDGKPGSDNMSRRREQRRLAGCRRRQRKDWQRQQHTDQNCDAGELPVIGIGDRPGPGELRLARGVEHAPVGADAAFECLPRLVVGLDDIVVDAERLGPGDETAEHASLHQGIGIGVAAVIARARPAELGDHDALARISLS